MNGMKWDRLRLALKENEIWSNGVEGSEGGDLIVVDLFSFLLLGPTDTEGEGGGERQTERERVQN